MKKLFTIIFLVSLSLIPLYDLFHNGLPITHDGQDHVARITNFYQNLKEGNFIPRWAANLNWGYGHPILMFLYPLPSYLASLFHFLGFGLIDSTKVVFGLAYILSGVTMYLWLRSWLGNAPGLVGGLLYLFAPYRFVDLYVRGAIGEHVAFIFPPLIFYFILKLAKRYSYWYIVGGSFSIAGLILSHNAITLMFLPLILLYGSYLLLFQSSSRKYFILNTSYLILLGFGLASFFWIPAFFEGKYTLRDIVTGGEYSARFVNFKDFLHGTWNYGITGQFSVQVGIVQWIVTASSLFTSIFLYKKKNSLWVPNISLFIIFWMTIFLMTQSSQFVWESITTLQKFQFPWRFLSLIVFITSVLGGLTFLVLDKKKQFVALCVFIIVLLWFNKDYWQAKAYLNKPGSFFTDVYLGTTDTGESSPRWSVRFMEKTPKAHIEIISGKATIKETRRASTEHKYEIIASEKTRIRENTLYFPGWQVLVDGLPVEIEFQDPQNRGLITFFVEKGEHIVQIIFKETKLRFLADMISGGSLAIVAIFIILILKRKKVWLQFR